MKYASIISAFLAEVWAIMPEKYAQIRAFLRLKAGGDEVSAEDISALVAARREDGVQMRGRVAILPVMGVISQRVGMIEEASGGISTEKIGASLKGLVDDKTVKAIVMAYDSPGGSISGLPELAAQIRAARDVKKVVSFIDPMAASAAYWLASQGSEMVVTPSGQVGSIGVLTGHEDITAFLEKAGIKTELIASAPFKTEGWPEVPLTDEARAEMQSKVNHYHGMFTADIAKGRGITAARVEKDFGQGRMLTAQAAVAAGMADRIGTLAQVLKSLGAGDSNQVAMAQTDMMEMTARVAKIQNSA